MKVKNHIRTSQTVRTYCAQCWSNCPVVAHIREGRFTRVSPDKSHPFHRPLCPKGLAGPQMVDDPARLEYPVRRGAPKGASDPCWQRISWEEALDEVAGQMAALKEKYGPETMVFSQTNVSSPMWEITCFIRRLANVYGTPNHMTTTHICNWHRDNGSALTFGKVKDDFSAGWPDFKNTGCMLLWGYNPKATSNLHYQQIRAARKRGAALIVVDPRRTDLAAQADLWLQVRPGTDGALALGLIHRMIDKKCYDTSFVTDWTNAPLLVRTDKMDLINIREADASGSTDPCFYMVDDSGVPIPYVPGSRPGAVPALRAGGRIDLPGEPSVPFSTVFSLLEAAVSEYTPEQVRKITGVPPRKLEECVAMMTRNSPSCWYSFNGLEQNMNATQTNRAVCTFYALTGDYDKKGGNVVLKMDPPLDYPFGFEFVTPEMFRKNLALSRHPLGPAGTIMGIPAYMFAESILTKEPYPVNGLISFGANTLSANPDSRLTARALASLDFHVHIDLTVNPTAQYAEIVLPSTTFWETGRLGYTLDLRDNQWQIQWRSPVCRPRGESRDEVWIVLELAKRLGYGANFWNGSRDSAFAEMLAPLDLTLEDIKASDGGISVSQPLAHRKYNEKGFDNYTGRVELFSQQLKDIDQSPLPGWQDPLQVFRKKGVEPSAYPFLLITAKVREYCQSQHRSVPSLRKKVPHPYIEINRGKALELGIGEGDSVLLETEHGRATIPARLTDGLAQDVVCTQHGWWQSCPALNLPGHDVCDTSGPNVNLVYGTDVADPVSGSVHMRGYPCNIKRMRHE
ncbi:MAG: molybdopterin-dependent oxidoreductase [Desulfobacterales bacterium]|nr:molybdopterin-dependent oxidoreductase [Desulfobacterales bacterium]